MPRYRIGIDVGGTFTDLYLLDADGFGSMHHKLPSTPANPHEAPIKGIIELLQKAGAKPTEVELLGLGTTVATNTLLERKGARTALITTNGFRDLIEIGRQKRPHVFDMFARKPRPLVSREYRFEVQERTASNGSLLQPLNEADLDRAIEKIRSLKIPTVAICFLHSYLNPTNERQAAAILARELPNVLVTTSEALIPEFREFERISTTAMNAYLLPVMRQYLMQFTDAVQRIGVRQEPFVMSSNGGILRPELAARRPIETLFSGPSGGVSGAIYLAERSNHPNIVTFDMGGTSTEVCVAQNGQPEVSNQRDVDGLPLKGTSIDIHTVGAGGSSIAWIDEGGMLRVGPQSVGADPGPACYGRGGVLPTMTDANVVLGRLNNRHLLAGMLPIDANQSFAAIQEHIARPKNISVEEAAISILAVSNVNVAQAIRFVSTQRGYDPADFVLVAFGGAGPLHAAAVSRELGMKAVLVPEGPGVLCAMGVLMKDVEFDVSASRFLRSDTPDAATKIIEIYADMEARARSELVHSAVELGSLVFRRSVDARYAGQNFELPVQMGEAPLNRESLTKIVQGFHDVHRRMYGYSQPDRQIEFVTFRLKAIIPCERPRLNDRSSAERNGALEPLGKRRTYFEDESSFVDCPIYLRNGSVCGVNLEGPAIVEQMDTTIVIPPDFVGEFDQLGNLILSDRRSALGSRSMRTTCRTQY